MVGKKLHFLFLILLASIALLIYNGITSNMTPLSLQRTIFGLSAHYLTNVNNIKGAYLVRTTNCKIVNWMPFDEQILSLYENMSATKLSCDAKFANYIIVKRHNYTGIKIKNKSDLQLECYGSHIYRKNTSDNTIYMTPSFAIRNEINYFPTDETVTKVTCMINKGHRVFEKVIPLIPYRRPKRMPSSALPNVLFLGLDSISRLNFERHFPLTKKYLSEHKFYTLFGYNKVADNTFVNLTPLLTGNYLEDIWNETISRSVFLNYFPFIWKEYEEQGYHTLLMEDDPPIATFNYLKSGFSEQPTTYYLRPYAIAIEDDIRDNCYLDKPEVETYYDYLHDFITAMKERQQSYFAFTFLSRLTHNTFNDAGLADPMLDKLFRKLFADNLLSNTVVIFFSDHGIRFGDIRLTLTGKLEERLPFMHIYLPEKWRNRHFDVNQHRLTTPFDIHATLTHIIRGKPDYNLRYGRTLLEEVGENRSCSDIPILDHWCACQESVQLTNLSLVRPMAEFVVRSVNQLLRRRYRDRCLQLKLFEITSAFEQHLSDKVLRFEHSLNDVIDRHVIYSGKATEVTKHYLITFKVKPSDAYFEATVRHNWITDNMALVGEVSRIDEYGQQSACIDDQFLRRYCYCNDYHNSVK